MTENYELQFEQLKTRMEFLIQSGGDENVIFGYLNKGLDQFFQNNYFKVPDLIIDNH